MVRKPPHRIVYDFGPSLDAHAIEARLFADNQRFRVADLLRLGRLYEERGDLARERYRNVLAARSDDPAALAAMARLAGTPEEPERWYAPAFDANPFSLSLIRDYQRHRLAVRAEPQHARGAVRIGLRSG